MNCIWNEPHIVASYVLGLKVWHVFLWVPWFLRTVQQHASRQMLNCYGYAKLHLVVNDCVNVCVNAAL